LINAGVPASSVAANRDEHYGRPFSGVGGKFSDADFTCKRRVAIETGKFGDQSLAEERRVEVLVRAGR